MKSRLRVVEAAVQNRVSDRSTQERILSAARERMANWLEQGALFAPFQARKSSVVLETDKRREQQR